MSFTQKSHRKISGTTFLYIYSESKSETVLPSKKLYLRRTDQQCLLRDPINLGVVSLLPSLVPKYHRRDSPRSVRFLSKVTRT